MDSNANVVDISNLWILIIGAAVWAYFYINIQKRKGNLMTKKRWRTDKNPWHIVREVVKSNVFLNRNSVLLGRCPKPRGL